MLVLSAYQLLDDEDGYSYEVVLDSYQLVGDEDEYSVEDAYQVELEDSPHVELLLYSEDDFSYSDEDLYVSIDLYVDVGAYELDLYIVEEP